MSSTLQIGGTTTGTLAPTIDTTSNVKTNNHSLNLTSHLNSQHVLQSNIQEVALNTNSSVHTNLSTSNSNTSLPIKMNVENNSISEKTIFDKPNVEMKVSVESKVNDETKVNEENKVNTENAANCTIDKNPEVIDDKKLSLNITKVKKSINMIAESKIIESSIVVKNNLNNTATTVAPNQTKTVNDDVTSTKTVEYESSILTTESIRAKTKEQESPKSASTSPNNNVTSTISSPNVIANSTPNAEAIATHPLQDVATTAIQPCSESRTPLKPASYMKLATVSSRTHIKRKRDLKIGVNNKKGLDDNEENCAQSSPKSKRARVKTQPYQSPLPEFAMVTKLSANMAKNKANDDKLIIFYKNEFLAVRNLEGGFYICQAMQNVYKSSPKIRIRWLSQNKNDATGETYSPDFYDFTDFDCILTNLNLNRLDKGLYKLPSAELERTKSILQRALNVEQGICSDLDITEEHPDGLDLSLYRDEAQLESKKKKSSNAKGKYKPDARVTKKQQPKTISLKSRTIKKSHKKKADKSIKVAKSKSIAKGSLKKKDIEISVKSIASGSRSRPVRTIIPIPSTSKAKPSIMLSKRKTQRSPRTTEPTKTKGRSSVRNISVPLATASRTSRTAKLMRDRRGQK